MSSSYPMPLGSLLTRTFNFMDAWKKSTFILLDAIYELSILLIMNFLWVDIQVQLNVLFHGILMLSM